MNAEGERWKAQYHQEYQLRLQCQRKARRLYRELDWQLQQIRQLKEHLELVK